MFLLFSWAGSNFTISAQESTKPKLIVILVSDPLSNQWIDKYADYLSDDGIMKLFQEGVVFTQAETGQFLASRSSSVTSIMTGAPASLHGIIGTSWYDRLKRDEVFSTEDYQSTDFVNFNPGARHSAHRVLVTTLGDQITQSEQGKMLSVCLEPDGAILAGGQKTNGTYWFDSQTGRWTSNSRFVSQLPQWVIDFNNANPSDLFLGQDWELIPGKPYEKARPDKSPYELGMYNNFSSFPYHLNRMKRNSSEGNYEVIRHVPAGNALLTNFAVSAIQKEQLGSNENTDLLAVTFTSFSKIIQRYGPDSQEAVDALVRLDMEIKHLLYVLNESVGKENCLVIFTATHGAAGNVDEAIANKVPAGRFRIRNAIALLNSYLSAIYGENFWIESYMNQQVYLDQTLIDKNKIPIDEIQEQAARFLTQFQGVANAYTATQLNSLQIGTFGSSPILNCFNTKRSGDILINLQPGWIQDGDFISDHLSNYPYDQRIPLVFWGAGLSHEKKNNPVNLQNIAPTICDLIRLPYPSGCQGKSLQPYLVYSIDLAR